tara:strand:+ start:1096 stop:1440 length:345 start_codon:yes stop_codon:yes gene_type:complete
MDVKRVVSFDQGVTWKSEHTSNPYAIVLKAKKIWKFTKTENPKAFKFFSSIIKDNAKIFRWGLQKQKSFKIFYHNEYCYFETPDAIIYRVVIQKDEKKKKVKKAKNNKKDKMVY